MLDKTAAKTDQNDLPPTASSYFAISNIFERAVRVWLDAADNLHQQQQQQLAWKWTSIVALKVEWITGNSERSFGTFLELKRHKKTIFANRGREKVQTCRLDRSNQHL